MLWASRHPLSPGPRNPPLHPLHSPWPRLAHLTRLSGWASLPPPPRSLPQLLHSSQGQKSNPPLPAPLSPGFSHHQQVLRLVLGSCFLSLPAHSAQVVTVTPDSAGLKESLSPPVACTGNPGAPLSLLQVLLVSLGTLLLAALSRSCLELSLTSTDAALELCLYTYSYSVLPNTESQVIVIPFYR